MPHEHLSDDVLLSVQGVARAVAPPEPELPRWLHRVLPKSGIAGQSGGGFDDEDDDMLDDAEEREPEEKTALAEISFDLHRGEGLGIVGDSKARDVLLAIIVGAIPPSSGRVVVRGLVAPLLKNTLIRYVGYEWGKSGVIVVAGFLHWPRSLIRKRWDEIEAFATLEDLKGLPIRKYRLKSTMRLLFSAALHMDATVYLVDGGIRGEGEYGARCLELLAERKAEGKAVLQAAQGMVEDVAGLCSEVMWLDDGALAFRGKPLDVARAMERSKKDEVHPLSVPLIASLPDRSGDAIAVSVEGATVEADVEVLRKNLQMGFTLVVTDRYDRTSSFEAPDRFVSESPGLHRLRVFVPGGLLADGVYDAKLTASIGVLGSESTHARDLVSFQLLATASDDAEAASEDGPTFELVPDFEDVSATADEVEWRVGGAAT